jgi:hypothetical protein
MTTFEHLYFALELMLFCISPQQHTPQLESYGGFLHVRKDSTNQATYRSGTYYNWYRNDSLIAEKSKCSHIIIMRKGTYRVEEITGTNDTVFKACMRVDSLDMQNDSLKQISNIPVGEMIGIALPNTGEFWLELENHYSGKSISVKNPKIFRMSCSVEKILNTRLSKGFYKLTVKSHGLWIRQTFYFQVV